MEYLKYTESLNAPNGRKKHSSLSYLTLRYYREDTDGTIRIRDPGSKNQKYWGGKET
jgi:hypothetical protein